MTPSPSPRIIGGHASEAGDGALSEEELYIDKHAEKEVYETPDATSIGKHGERSEREERLQEVNEERDRFSDGFAERMHYADRRRVVEALCSSLPVSQTEQELAISAFENLDLDQFGNQKAVEKVAFATIRHVVDERRIEHGADWEDLLRDSDEYQDAKERVLPNERGFMKLCDKVSDAIERIPLGPQFSTTIPGRDPNLPDSSRNRPYSGENWYRFSPEAWEHTARNWDSQPEYVKEKVPDEYRELVEQLRRWEPWNEIDQEAEEDEEEPSSLDSEGNSSEDTRTERAEELLDELQEEIDQHSA
jgi:hypothetical protein